jgi:hypothetical protein
MCPFDNCCIGNPALNFFGLVRARISLYKSKKPKKQQKSVKSPKVEKEPKFCRKLPLLLQGKVKKLKSGGFLNHDHYQARFSHGKKPGRRGPHPRPSSSPINKTAELTTTYDELHQPKPCLTQTRTRTPQI